jgi:hypothetical protein
LRKLTAEGIEPNPGPILFQDLVNKVKERLGSSFVDWEKPFSELYSNIKTPHSLVVSLNDTLAYIQDPVNSDALLKVGFDPQALQVLQEAAASLSTPTPGTLAL